MDVDRDWETIGACVQPDAPPVHVFFPERRRGSSNTGAVAKATCARCPVAADCLVDSLARREKFGIRGGAGESIRRALLRSWRLRPHPEVGYDRDCSCVSCAAIGGHLAALVAGRPSRLDANGPGVRHGTAIAYNRGCSDGPGGGACDDCALARAMHDAEVRLVARGVAA